MPESTEQSPQRLAMIRAVNGRVLDAEIARPSLREPLHNPRVCPQCEEGHD